MIVADTGVVNGHSATTNPADFDYVEAHAPSATWLHNLRYVDDGAVVTSSALSSGIDATLHVVDRFAVEPRLSMWRASSGTRTPARLTIRASSHLATSGPRWRSPPLLVLAS